MKRIPTLGNEAINAGAVGQVIFDLTNIPDQYEDDGYRVLFFLIHIHLVVTVASAKTCDFIEILRMFNQINLNADSHPFVADMDAWDLFLLDAYEHGNYNSPVLAQLAAGAGQVVDFDLFIRFPHIRQIEHQDGAIPAEIFNDGQLIISHLAAPNADTTVTAGSIELSCSMDRKNDLAVPPYPTLRTCVKHLDDKLPAGIWKSLFIEAVNDKTFGFAAAANLTALRYDALGEDILKTLTPDQVLGNYHGEQADGPMGAAAAMFPGPNGWAAHYGSIGLMPLIWECKNTGASKVPQAVDTGNRSLNMHNGGSLTSVRYVGRYYAPLDVGRVNQWLSNRDVQPSEVEVDQKTVSKTTLSKRRLALHTPGLRGIPVKVKKAVSSKSVGGKYAKRVLLQGK